MSTATPSEAVSVGVRCTATTTAAAAAWTDVDELGVGLEDGAVGVAVGVRESVVDELGVGLVDGEGLALELDGVGARPEPSAAPTGMMRGVGAPPAPTASGDALVDGLVGALCVPEASGMTAPGTTAPLSTISPTAAAVRHESAIGRE